MVLIYRIVLQYSVINVKILIEINFQAIHNEVIEYQISNTIDIHRTLKLWTNHNLFYSGFLNITRMLK